MKETRPLMTRGVRPPRLGEALVPVVALILLLGGNLLVYHGDPHIPLILASLVAGGMAYTLGYQWAQIQEGIVHGITVALTAILILMVIGIMIGTWIASGVVPVLIYYGLKLFSPQVFLFAACLICAVVSVATGSSWTTAGTVGVALIGVGKGLEVPLPMVAGAIISGAYFGDKISPLSDSTNLAPAVAGSELFEHIRHMMYTTLPALVIALVLYAILGITLSPEQGSGGQMEVIRSTLAAHFELHPILFLPPVLVILMVIYRVPALPALLAGGVLGGVLACWIQGVGLGTVIVVAHQGYESNTGVASVDDLLSGGGLMNMMGTVALILCALTFGGIMERAGMLRCLAEAILKLASNTGRLIAATVATCVGMNVIAPDQYLSIIVPGRMYRDAYRERGLHLKNLSRTLEDAGTLSSPLVPWNTCGAYMGTTLGVMASAYFPFAFLNLITPFIAILYGFTGWCVERADERPGGRKE